MDLSNNEFVNFPHQLQKFEFLQYLDISENHISRLRPNALHGLQALRFLNLSKNNISSWTSISPRNLLEPAVSLQELSLSGNHFTSFSTNDENLLLISNSLKMLDLSHCKISKVFGAQILEGMKELYHLNLASNQIRSISDLTSASLAKLDLSRNRLTSLSVSFMSNLPSLSLIDLSGNHRISLKTKLDEFVHSESLKSIDLSNCNLDSIELQGFPGLVKVFFRRNMIYELTSDSFANSQMIEILDLSYNAINSIEVSTFKKLKHLKSVNLSFNNIGKIERETFKENEQLTTLDLSWNQLNRFNRIIALAMTDLNMTWNQISIVDSDALSGVPYLISLDISSNSIVDFPDSLAAEYLQNIDMSMNRLTHLKASTFNGFPELRILNLSGNRFTTPFRKEHFEENVFLEELNLADNPWHCNCHEMYNFYIFITDSPSRVTDRSALRCHSPEEFFLRTWESSCMLIWYPRSTMGTTEKVWTFLMVCVLGELSLQAQIEVY